jgi:DNA replication protein DnaC
MDESLKEHLRYLGLKNLECNWDTVIKQAQKQKPSYHTLLQRIITQECEVKTETQRLNRIKNAKIPEMLVMETFPFARQPKLKKKMVLQVYDSLQFINEQQVLLFVGPTGCGKTGLATSFLVHAINHNCRGMFIDFKQLMAKLYQSCADNSSTRMIRKLTSVDCMLIDEFGYAPLQQQQAGLFFDLIKARHKNKCTIITSQLGFEKWANVITDQHLNAAIIDRITENCAVFNMTRCVSLRKKKILYGTDDNPQ